MDQVFRRRPYEPVLIKGRMIVTDLPLSIREDIEVTCYGQNVSVKFVAGEQRNKIVIQLDEEGQIRVHRNFHHASYLGVIEGAIRRNWRPVLGECLGTAATVLEKDTWENKFLAFSLRMLAKVVVDGHA